MKSYSAPAVPKAPAAPTDLAAELSAYDAAEPTSTPVKAAGATEGSGSGGAMEFLAFLEQDLPKADAHH